MGDGVLEGVGCVCGDSARSCFADSMSLHVRGWIEQLRNVIINL
jgi:hypothetical protein